MADDWLTDTGGASGAATSAVENDDWLTDGSSTQNVDAHATNDWLAADADAAAAPPPEDDDDWLASSVNEQGPHLCSSAV